ncbi:MAG: hypothetical protein FRX48_09333 [Lasallia pustulata]|uniref:Uncharacterized protein n=1 Tax=Lasallia pustulata TaxID=136370 RepID=A0A5M8PC71_9LECA|nr:MAG: hypothetical protein FRX48_09333 [Lasallia pustulata]
MDELNKENNESHPIDISSEDELEYLSDHTDLNKHANPNNHTNLTEPPGNKSEDENDNSNDGSNGEVGNSGEEDNDDREGKETVEDDKNGEENGGDDEDGMTHSPMSATIRFNIEDLEEGEDVILEKEINQKGIEQSIPIGVAKNDPVPKRLVMANFSMECSSMCRVIPFKIKRRGIVTRISPTEQNQPTRRQYQGSTLAPKGVAYRRGWEGLRGEQEGEKLFKWLKARSYTKGWGYKDYHHMRRAKYLRAYLHDARQQTEDPDLYELFQPFGMHRHQRKLSSDFIKMHIHGVLEAIMPSFKQMDQHIAKLSAIKIDNSSKNSTTKSLKKVIKAANNTLQALQLIFGENGQPNLTETAGLEDGLEINDPDQPTPKTPAKAKKPAPAKVEADSSGSLTGKPAGSATISPSTSDDEEDNTMDLPNQTGAYGLKLKVVLINPAELPPLPSLFDNAGPTDTLMLGAGSDIHSDDNNATNPNDASDSIDDAPNLINPCDFINLSSIMDMSNFTDFTEPTPAPLLATDEYMMGTPNHAEEGMDEQMGGMNENESIALSTTVGEDQDMIDGQPSHWWTDPSPRALHLRGSIPPA